MRGMRASRVERPVSFTKKAFLALLLLWLAPFIMAQATVPITEVGSDIGAQINAAFAACSNACVVSIPAGRYPYNTTIKMTTPSESLVGAGSYATILNYKGSGDGILWQMSTWPPGIYKAGTLRGVSIVGTAKAANCIHSGSLIGSTWDDVTVSGCTGANANGILLENACIGGRAAFGSCVAGTQAYTERINMHNVHIGYSGQPSNIPGNKTGLHLLVKGGTRSFGYNELDVYFNTNGAQTGLLVDAGAQLYHSDLTLKGNIANTGGSFVTVKGQIIQGTLNVLAEANASPQTDAFHVTSTGQVYAQGNVQILGSAGNPHTTTPLVDSGGFYAVEPWIALDYSGTQSVGLFSVQALQMPMIETGARLVSSDGPIIVAQPDGTAAVSGDFSGRLILNWPHNHDREATMIIDVACAQHEAGACQFNVPVNYAYAGESVFSDPTIKLTGGALRVPQIQVTIGNRNGVSQNVMATWYGVAGAATNAGGPRLFPNGVSLASKEIRLTGLRSDAVGNLTTAGQMTVASMKTAGSMPSCTFSSGGGKSPNCFLDAGSTNSAGTIIATTGGGPSGTGNITLTFNSSPFGTNKPVCQYQASDGGAGIWNQLAVMKDKTPCTSSDLFTWTNGTTPTALSASTAYWINYQCWAK
jgi:hypothetical protein